MTGPGIIQQLDQLLRSNQLDTRAGLHFMGELVKDAFTYIEEQRNRDVIDADTLKSFSVRIGNVENGLNEFLKRREQEQRDAADERKFYRRAVIGGLITLIISQIAQWLIR